MLKLIKVFLAVVICEAIGILGSIFTISQISIWYQHLNKPFFSPPNFIFAPVWTTLYALIGISIFLIFESKAKRKEKNNLLFLFSFHLFLNLLWSILFFGMHLLPAAFIEIVFLWGIILLLIIKFYKHSKLASYLLIPYLVWVSFAAILNLFIVILNSV